MGGTPLTALNIVAFPTDPSAAAACSPNSCAAATTRSTTAGAVLVGGHTIIDDELKYGLAVTGRVDPARMLTNAAARTGDRLVLTKPLGNGMLATALKQRSAGGGSSTVAGAKRAARVKKPTLPGDAERGMVEFMTRLNREAAEAAAAAGVRCATDVTGFGLLGHALHIARASGVTLAIRAASVPALVGAAEAYALGSHTGGEQRNLSYLESLVDWGGATPFERALLVDPQTLGGLLIAVPAARVREYVSRVEDAVEIGDVRAAGSHAIVIE